MSTQPHARTHHIGNATITTIMNRPWYVDLLAFALVALWMAWTYASIQQYGPDPVLILGAVVFAVTAILMIYGQRITHVKFGRFEYNARQPRREQENDETNPLEDYR